MLMRATAQRGNRMQPSVENDILSLETDHSDRQEHLGWSYQSMDTIVAIMEQVYELALEQAMEENGNDVCRD